MSDDLTALSDADLDELGYELQREKDLVRERQLAVNEERTRRAALPPGEPVVQVEGATAESNGGTS